MHGSSDHRTTDSTCDRSRFPGRRLQTGALRFRQSCRNTFDQLRSWSAILPICAVPFLAGCGGGGGGVGGEPACYRTVFGCLAPEEYAERRRPIEQEYSAERTFKNQWGLEAIRADRAWAELELALGAGTRPGSGQTVGVIDSGIDQQHPAFSGKSVHEVFWDGAIDETGDSVSHGTSVAGVIAGNPTNNSFIQQVNAARGVAWGADIAMFALTAGSGGGAYRPVPTTFFPTADAEWTSRVNHVIGWSQGALDFVNVSLGYEGIIDQYSTIDLRNGFDGLIPALAQSGRSQKTIFVFAAGNAHGSSCDPADFTGTTGLCVPVDPNDPNTTYTINAKSPETLAGLPARIPELRGIVLAVVATDSTGRIASFSNRCGLAASSCLAAPGRLIRTAYFGPHPDTNTPGSRGAHNASGTSFSAPMVTGSLAVMKQFFRGRLSSTQLVSRLLSTANDRGIYADSSIYGHGLLDLAAAISPQGTSRISANGAEFGVGQTRLVSGDAVGDGLKRAFAEQEIVALDDLGSPFWYSLHGLVPASTGFSPGTRLRQFMAPERTGPDIVLWRPVLGGFDAGAATGNGWARPGLGILDMSVEGALGGHLSLAGQAIGFNRTKPSGWTVTAFSNEGLERKAPVSGVTMSWKPAGMPIRIRLGWVGERKALLRSRTSGAFGRTQADSLFAGIEGAAHLGAWRVSAGAEIGRSTPSVHGGMIVGVSPLRTSSLAIRALRNLDNRTSVTLSLAQPLRVESGHVRFSVPVDLGQDGRLLHRDLSAPLEPTGRQIELAAHWRRALARTGGELRLGTVLTRHPGHSATAEPHAQFMVGWRRVF